MVEEEGVDVFCFSCSPGWYKGYLYLYPSKQVCYVVVFCACYCNHSLPVLMAMYML